MRRALTRALALLLLALALGGGARGATFGYRFADADEAARLLLGNRDYFEGLTQIDLDFRVQKKGATLEELEALAAAQTLDFTDAEKAAVDAQMARIEAVCADRGYALPPTDGIVFAKTTLREECGAGPYTHGAQVYLGQAVMDYSASKDPARQRRFAELVAHELFHCLTRGHPEFRAAMYGALGFRVADRDFEIDQSIMDRVISNPDVERHDAWAAFEIGGEMRDCVVVFAAGRPFERPGDCFFDAPVTGLVPVDDPSVMYTAEDAANFREVFGENTDYVIDPEEVLADNFGLLLTRDPEELAGFPSPEIFRKMEAVLTGEADG